MQKILEHLGTTKQRANDLAHAFSLINTDHFIYLLCRVIVTKDKSASLDLYGGLYSYFHCFHADASAAGISAAIVTELISPRHCNKCKGFGQIKKLTKDKKGLEFTPCDKCEGKGWRWRSLVEYEECSGISKSTWQRKQYSVLVQFWVKTLEALASDEARKIGHVMH